MPNILFQDGFESGDFSNWDINETHDGNLEVRTIGGAHSGSNQAYFWYVDLGQDSSPPNAPPGAWIMKSFDPPYASNIIDAQFWMNIQSDVLADASSSFLYTKYDDILSNLAIDSSNNIHYFYIAALVTPFNTLDPQALGSLPGHADATYQVACELRLDRFHSLHMLVYTKSGSVRILTGPKLESGIYYQIDMIQDLSGEFPLFSLGINNKIVLQFKDTTIHTNQYTVVGLGSLFWLSNAANKIYFQDFPPTCGIYYDDVNIQDGYLVDISDDVVRMYGSSVVGGMKLADSDALAAQLTALGSTTYIPVAPIVTPAHINLFNTLTAQIPTTQPKFLYIGYEEGALSYLGSSTVYCCFYLRSVEIMPYTTRVIQYVYLFFCLDVEKILYGTNEDFLLSSLDNPDNPGWAIEQPFFQEGYAYPGMVSTHKNGDTLRATVHGSALYIGAWSIMDSSASLSIYVDGAYYGDYNMNDGLTFQLFSTMARGLVTGEDVGPGNADYFNNIFTPIRPFSDPLAAHVKSQPYFMDTAPLLIRIGELEDKEHELLIVNNNITNASHSTVWIHFIADNTMFLPQEIFGINTIRANNPDYMNTNSFQGIQRAIQSAAIIPSLDGAKLNLIDPSYDYQGTFFDYTNSSNFDDSNFNTGVNLFLDAGGNVPSIDGTVTLASRIFYQVQEAVHIGAMGGRSYIQPISMTIGIASIIDISPNISLEPVTYVSNLEVDTLGGTGTIAHISVFNSTTVPPIGSYATTIVPVPIRSFNRTIVSMEQFQPLSRPVTIFGYLTDPEQNPVVGATIKAIPNTNSENLALIAKQYVSIDSVSLSTVTNSTGRWSLRLIAPQDVSDPADISSTFNYTLVLDALGIEPVYIETTAFAWGAQAIEVSTILNTSQNVLTVPMSGFIVDVSGKPKAHSVVSFILDDKAQYVNNTNIDILPKMTYTITDSEGFYTLRVVPSALLTPSGRYYIVQEGDSRNIKNVQAPLSGGLVNLNQVAVVRTGTNYIRQSSIGPDIQENFVYKKPEVTDDRTVTLDNVRSVLTKIYGVHDWNTLHTLSTQQTLRLGVTSYQGGGDVGFGAVEASSINALHMGDVANDIIPIIQVNAGTGALITTGSTAGNNSHGKITWQGGTSAWCPGTQVRVNFATPYVTDALTMQFGFANANFFYAQQILGLYIVLDRYGFDIRFSIADINSANIYSMYYQVSGI